MAETLEELEDQFILEKFHIIRQHGHGELRIAVVDGKMDTVWNTGSDKRDSWLPRKVLPKKA